MFIAKIAKQVLKMAGELGAQAPGVFPETFGLKGFPGKTFRVNFDKSYDDFYVVEIKSGGSWKDFSKGTEEELLKEIQGG